MNIKLRKIQWIAVFSLFLFSCKKDLKESFVPVSGNETTAGVATPPLAWETINFMPMPAGSFTVSTPWGSSHLQVPVEMRDDYKSLDGWRLVYNTFNTTSMPDHLYFVLYNVYRGIIRLYYYTPPTANYTASDNISHTLTIVKSYAASSPMMNFSGQNIVDVATKSSFASVVDEAQLSPGTWYAMQYDLAYDKNMSGQSYTTFAFDWVVKSLDFSTIELGGTVSGDIIGSISIPGTNFSISPTFNINANKGNITMGGTSTADKLTSKLGANIVNAVKSGIQSGVSGFINNILSGIFKKKGTTPDENVHLKIDAQIKLTGNISNNLLVAAPTFAMPGYNQTSTVGYNPDYNSPLGVFYLSAKPVVKIRKTHNNTGDIETSTTDIEFAVDNDSYVIDYNPAVTSVATIQNVTREAVAINPAMSIVGYSGSEEIVGNSTIYTWLGFLTVPYGTVSPNGFFLPFQVGVRISFDVVPNNGAQPVRIAKTFLATLAAM